MTSFALRLGISPTYLYQIEQGLVPGEARLRDMAASIGEDPEEWLSAAGLRVTDVVAEPSGAYSPRPSTAWLPVIGTLRAAAKYDPEEEPGEQFPCLPEHSSQADGVIRVEGDSAFPLVLPGDWLAVRKTSVAHPGDLVIARVGGDGETVVKRFVGRREGLIVLESVNPSYPPTRAAEVEILGVVVWQRRSIEALRKFGR
jgi:SOS-response transcriptional repressor LexA